MTSSGAHENGLKQKLANLLETIGHGSPLAGGAYNAQKGMNSWVTFFGLKGATIVRHSQHVCLCVVTMRSVDHPFILFHRGSGATVVVIPERFMETYYKMYQRLVSKSTTYRLKRNNGFVTTVNPFKCSERLCNSIKN